MNKPSFSFQFYPLFFLCLLFCTSCSSDSQDFHPKSTLSITGRAEEGSRFPVYRTPIVTQWIKRDPLPEETLEDTTKSLCDFFIRDNGETVRIAIHNFPSASLEDRIPPSAQLARWQQQLGYVAPSQSTIEPQAFSGYSGLMLWAETETQAVLGWSMQIGTEHYRSLSDLAELESSKRFLYRQMRADVTIKATGSPSMLRKHAESIKAFARSFELIEEIPPRS